MRLNIRDYVGFCGMYVKVGKDEEKMYFLRYKYEYDILMEMLHGKGPCASQRRAFFKSNLIKYFSKKYIVKKSFENHS